MPVTRLLIQKSKIVRWVHIKGNTIRKNVILKVFLQWSIECSLIWHKKKFFKKTWLRKFVLYNARTSDAGIAQLVEHNLAMVRVASSNLVSRSNSLLIISIEILKNTKNLLSRRSFFHFFSWKTLFSPHIYK